MSRWARVVTLTAAYLAILVCWQLIANADAGPQSLLSGPVQITQTIIEKWQILLEASIVTLTEAIVGLFGAVILGVTVAVIIDAVDLVGPTVYRLSVILYSVPLIALAPLLVLWFGPTFTARAVTAMVASFLPIVINTVQGLRGAPHAVTELGSSLAMSRISILSVLRFRYAVPSFLASLKIAGPAAFIGAMLAEWVNAERGLGISLLYAMFSFNVEGLWSTLVVATFWSGAIYLMFDTLAKRATPWHASAGAAR